MTWPGFGSGVQYLQAQLFPICPITAQGFLGSFLTKSIKTNQLEVNTDEKTLRSIARLKEPRDLFALPKDRDYDCPQQAARWPTECQVLEERVYHIEWNPNFPELYFESTGNELKPHPVGEENGIVVYNYNPVSAVNYNLKSKGNGDESDGSDSEISSSESRSPSPDPMLSPNGKEQEFTKLFRSHRSSSNSDAAEEDDDGDEQSNLNGYKKNSDTPPINENVDEELLQYHDPYDFQQPPVKCVIERVEKVSEPLNFSTHSLAKTARLLDRYESPEEDDENNDEIITSLNNSSSKLTSRSNSILEQRPSRKKCSQITLKNHNKPACPSAKKNSDNNIFNNKNASAIDSQFSRSSVGGAKFLQNVHPASSSEGNLDELNYDGLEFESRFESGNLAKAVKITSTYYELYLRPDLYTNRHKQWFYFRVTKTKKNIMYRFSIVNLVKSDSLYNEGMRPLMYSSIIAKEEGEGWRRCGDNIAYYRTDDEASSDEDDENSTYTLTFTIKFAHDDDIVYFAHSYPYTYSDLQDYLMEIQKHPIKSKFCKLRLLCRSLAGNNVYYLTVTAPALEEDPNVRKTFPFKRKKKAIVVSARVHPGETPSSWMMKGLMDFITGESNVAKRLRHKFIFKLIPMLNPDGVIVGNTRSSLTGKDLNRQYRTVIRETYPSIWYTKAMIKRLIDECGVAMYCDMHAHSRRQNVFVYGCENKRLVDRKLTEQVFPLMMHKNVADKFSFENCKFKVQRSKEGTGRIVIWMLGVTNSYTIEASFGGSSLGSRNGTHFSAADYEHMGRAFCETLLDYYDENPVKVKKRERFLKRIKRLRKRERRERKAMKLKKLLEGTRILDESILLITDESKEKKL